MRGHPKLHTENLSFKKKVSFKKKAITYIEKDRLPFTPTKNSLDESSFLEICLHWSHNFE